MDSTHEIDRFNALKAEALGLISAADIELLDPLLSRCHCINAAAGDIILKNNTANTVAYILLKGRLEVTLDPGQASAIAEILPGELVGEVSALIGKQTSAWVKAADASELVELERDTLLTMARTSHHFSYSLLQSVCNRLYSSNRAAQKSEKESLQNLKRSMTDQLTGLKNRTWLDNNTPELLEHLTRRDSGLYFFMIDLDHFKRVNDTWGHAIGDLVLREVAQTLVLTLRPSDHVVRMGGEEILALTDNIKNPDAAATMAERMRSAVESLLVIPDNNAEDGVKNKAETTAIRVTTSIGWSRCKPGESLENVLARADQAVYRAKEAGRNRVEPG